MCIMGASCPAGRPEPTANEHEKNLTKNAFILSTCRITVPLRNPITSGIPEPPAAGQTNYNIQRVTECCFYLGWVVEMPDNWIITDSQTTKFVVCWFVNSPLFEFLKRRTGVWINKILVLMSELFFHSCLNQWNIFVFLVLTS